MRLIDADVVKQNILEVIKKQGGTSKDLIPVRELPLFIDIQPTAYDVGKVVEELEIIKEYALAEYNIGEYNLDNNIGDSIAENYRKDMNEGKCFAYCEAIEIVKQGGVGKDVE